MTTITEEVFARNLAYYLREAVRKGLRVVTSEGVTIDMGRSKYDDDDSRYTKDAFFAMVDRAKAEAEAGHVYKKRPDETAKDFLDRLIAE